MKKPVGNNGHHDLGVSNPAPASPPAAEPAEDFSGVQFVNIEEDQSPGAERPKAAGGKRRRRIRGFLFLAMLALIGVGVFFWISGSGRKKIDLAVRDRAAPPDQPTPQNDDLTAQAIAEVRSATSASPSPSPASAAVETSTVADTAARGATARDTAPVTVPLGGTVASVENPPAPAASGASSMSAPPRSYESASGRNTERSIRCAMVQKPAGPPSKQSPAPDLARAAAGATAAPPAALEKTATLPPFGALLPVRTLGAIYTLRPSLARFALTRDVRGDGWMMKKDTVLVGQMRGGELDRAYVSLTGFIDPNSGKLVRLSGDALGADGAPGLRGKRRRLGSRWARILSRAADAAVALGQAALSRGGTIVNVPNAVSPELQGFAPGVVNAREFVEVSAGAAAFVLVTDLPKEIRGVAPQPGADESGDAPLGDEELAKLVTDGSPEQIRAALPRMSPELRRIAEAVLRESNNTDVAEGYVQRKR
jgi:hypothetical protein